MCKIPPEAISVLSEAHSSQFSGRSLEMLDALRSTPGYVVFSFIAVGQQHAPEYVY